MSESLTPPELLEKRILLFSEEINRSTTKELIKNILILDSISHDPITLYFSSQGGDVETAYAVHDIIKHIESPVTIIGLGLVASASIIIYLSVPLERRLCFKNTTFMIHQPLTDIEGHLEEIESRGTQLDEIRDRMDSLISSETGKSLEQVKQDTDTDTWFNAEASLEYGIVGKIL